MALDQTSVPGGVLNGDGSVTVPGQGKWVYNDSNGELTFTPCADGDTDCPTGGFTGDPSPIDYTLTETATGLSDTATVTVDYLEPGNITGTTWLDVDGDGVNDIGEPGIGGVTVYLLDGAGNPVRRGGSPIATAVTDANGDYTFPDLPPGDYQTQVDPAELTGGELDGWTKHRAISAATRARSTWRRARPRRPISVMCPMPVLARWKGPSGPMPTATGSRIPAKWGSRM